jgi:hypothetical protein
MGGAGKGAFFQGGASPPARRARGGRSAKICVDMGHHPWVGRAGRTGGQAGAWYAGQGVGCFERKKLLRNIHIAGSTDALKVRQAGTHRKHC